VFRALRCVAPAETQAHLILERAGGITWTSDPLFANGTRVAGWYQLHVGGGNYLFNPTLQVASPRLSTWRIDSHAPDVAYLLEPQDGQGRTLSRMSLSDGSRTVIATAVSSFNSNEDSSANWVVSGCSDNRCTISRLVLETGALTQLLADASIRSVMPGGLLVVDAGAERDIKLVRVAAGQVVAIDDGPANVSFTGKHVLTGTPAATAPQTLKAFDTSTLQSRLLSTTAAGSGFNKINGTVFWYEEGTKTKAIDLDAAAQPVELCSYPYQLELSDDAKVFIYYCGSPTNEWRLVHLTPGTSEQVFAGIPVSGWDPVYLSPHGRALVGRASYSSGPGPCGTSSCLVLRDISTSQQRLDLPIDSIGNFAGMSETESAGFIQTSPNLMVRFGAGAPEALTLPERAYEPVSGPDGRFGSWSSINSTRYLSDIEAGTSVSLGSGGLQWWGTPRVQFVIGNKLVSLADGSITSLGSSVTSLVFSSDGQLFTWLDGDRLARYQRGQGLTTLATSARQIATNLFVTDFDGAKGTLAVLDREAGTLTPLLSGFGPTASSLRDQKYFVLRNPTLTAGDLYMVDVAAKTLTDLGVHARSPVSLLASSTDRVAVHGEEQDGSLALYVSRLDGSSAHLVGAEASSASFSPDGSRLFFVSSGLRWVEQGAGALAIDQQGFLSTTLTSADGRFILYGLSTSQYPESQRNGTYRVDLP
jgi:hypothetical protein